MNKLFTRLALSSAASLCLSLTCPAKSPVDSVNPFIGTDAHGHVYPVATVPFGMVQLSPDTRTTTWMAVPVITIPTATFSASRTILTGTGCADLGNVLLMPTVGQLKLVPGAKLGEGYQARFSHQDETAHPGQRLALGGLYLHRHSECRQQWGLYVDGVLKAQGTVPKPSGSSSDVWIGGAPDYGSERLLAGSIAHAAVFTNALTAAQVLTLYYASTNVPPAFLKITPGDPGNLILDWYPGTLLQATNLTGPWTTNLGAAPLAIAPTNSPMFFRVLVN